MSRLRSSKTSEVKSDCYAASGKTTPPTTIARNAHKRVVKVMAMPPGKAAAISSPNVRETAKCNMLRIR